MTEYPVGFLEEAKYRSVEILKTKLSEYKLAL